MAIELKVGDKVYVKRNFRCRFGNTTGMVALAGKQVTIVSVDRLGVIGIAGNIFNWDKDCFQKTNPDKVKSEVKLCEAKAFTLPVARNARDEEIVRLTKRVTNSSFKAKAVKVEMEGVIGRGGAFMSNRYSNDFLLEYLAQFGLAEPAGSERVEHSEKYKPKLPLVFSKVYNDSETEWTFTLALDNPENILLLPHFVDAFNELRKANGKKSFDVRYSGMHMSFMHDTVYPTYRFDEPEFELFQRNARFVLPALFFVSANYKKNGKVVTRGGYMRQPQISTTKCSAIHYSGGALEFRVFDTCYQNREHILDNVAFMAIMVSKYWGKDLPVKEIREIRFGYERTELPLNRWYNSKDVVELLNIGLKCIKPKYLKIGDMKKTRGLTVNKKTVGTDQSGSFVL